MRFKKHGAHWATPLVLLCAIMSSGLCRASSVSTQTGVHPAEVIPIWAGAPPGTGNWTGPEQSADVDLPNLGRVHIITNVTIPTFTVFRPTRVRSTGTAMVIVPGGAFRALPWDLDGLETAHWLTARGITAFVLKYRVRPPSHGTPPDRTFEDFGKRTKAARELAVADAEQSMRVIRANAGRFGIATDRIGMIGFSAGAMTAAIVADDRDPAARPDFVASLYGAVFSDVGPLTTAAPIFLVAAQDDTEAPAMRSVEIFERWTAAKRPAELHLYERGGHGFAFRPHGLPSDQWPAEFEAWLRSRKLITLAKGSVERSGR
jgi:acetyl esterase/lipase